MWIITCLKFSLVIEGPKKNIKKSVSEGFFPSVRLTLTLFKESNLNKILEDFGNDVDNFREINQVPIDFKMYFIQ